MKITHNFSKYTHLLRTGLVQRAGIAAFVLLPVLVFGQNNSQAYGQGAYSSQGQSNYAVQPAPQGQTQPAAQNSVAGLRDANSISAQQVIQLLKENPSLASECKTVMMNRLREEGRTPPGGQITPEFAKNEIQTDPELKARLVQVFQQHGLLPATSTAGTQTAGGSNVSSTAMQMVPGNAGNVALQNAMPNTQPGTFPQAPQSQLVQGMQQVQPPANVEQEGPKPWKPELTRQAVPYGDLRALRDLYTKIKVDTADLERFGLGVFRNGTGNTDLLPVDLPAGPDYVLGSGDTLNIHLWGGVDQELTQVVDRTGRVSLPETGSVMVATRTLAQAQEMIRSALARQFRNVKVDISLARVRTVRVYVVGDVLRPGAYDISSLSTCLNALYSAGGPTDQGSLRFAKHYRGDKLVANVDLYELLLNGVSKDVTRLESGDTIVVPPIGVQVTVAGMVRRPAIYEVNDGTDLAHVVELAGGLQASATLGNIRVDRVEAYKRHVTMSLQVPDASDSSAVKNLLGSFRVQDGDRVVIAPILPYSEQAVYLEGHVFRPGKHGYENGMKVSDLIHSYQDVLPEPSEHAELIRLMPPEYRPVVIEFKMSEALSKEHPIYLQPFDTVRVFGRYELDPPTVTINGEVLRPGEYPMAKGMTTAELVRIAGGFKRSAFLDRADISSYVVQNGTKVISEHKTIDIGKALNGDADIALKPGDVVTVRQLSGWADVGASVTLGGEVVHPGTYGIGIGEKLSSVLERAGGFRETAFAKGAVLERVQVKELAQKSQDELVERIQTQGLGMSFAASSTAQETQAQMQAVIAQQKQVVDALRSHPPSGRLVINISSEIRAWKGTAADIEVRNGDSITIPKRPNLVMVNGQVYNPSAMTFIPGRTAEFYLRSAGGFTELANKRAVFIVRADGSVVSNGGGVWHGNVLSTRVQPGDMIIAPEKIIGGSAAWRNVVSAAQIASGLAIAARVATSF